MVTGVQTCALPISHIAYESTVPDAGEDPALIEAAMLAELGRMRPKEIDRGRSLVGPHRDDLVITLGDVPAKGFALRQL